MLSDSTMTMFGPRISQEACGFVHSLTLRITPASGWMELVSDDASKSDEKFFNREAQFDLETQSIWHGLRNITRTVPLMTKLKTFSLIVVPHC